MEALNLIDIVFAVFDDDPAVPNTTNLYIGCINPKVRPQHFVHIIHGKIWPAQKKKVTWFCFNRLHNSDHMALL